MKIKLDENIGRRGVGLFRDAGHDVSTVYDQDLSSIPDRRLMGVCAAEDRCLVTLDQEFANPMRFPPGGTPGIAVLRLPPKSIPGDLEEAMKVLITAMQSRPISGHLWVVHRGRIREYQPDN